MSLPFSLPPEFDAAPLAAALVAGEYPERSAHEASGDSASNRIAFDVARILRKLTAPSVGNTLLRLFMLGQSEPKGAVEQALPGVDVGQLLEMGFLTASGDRLSAAAMLFQFEGLWTVCDFPPEVGRPETGDRVMGVGMSTLMLSNLTVRRSGQRTLDLGTGGGFQAYLASRHSTSVVATDLNPKALLYAELGALLNGLHDLSYRAGSLFEPVASTKFDLIVSNPPFAISPERGLTYRDGGEPGDGIVEKVVRQAAAHLSEDGFATIIGDWIHTDENEWSARPRNWLAGVGCDAWLLRFDTIQPADYAASWFTARERQDQEDYGRRLDEWLAYYQQLGVAGMTRGALVFRKRSATTNWVEEDTVEFRHSGAGCSEQILRIFAGYDLLASQASPFDLLGAKLRLAPGCELRHRLELEGSRWLIREAELRHAKGFDFVGHVDQAITALLSRCDGQRTLAENAQALADQLGADRTSVAQGVVPVVRMLLTKGFFEIVA